MKYLAFIYLAGVFLVYSWNGNWNIHEDVRSLVKPYSLEEIRYCFESNNTGQALLRELASKDIVLEWGERIQEGSVLIRFGEPLGMAGAYYTHHNREIVLPESYRSYQGCDDQASYVAHELQHALDRIDNLDLSHLEIERRGLERGKGFRHNNSLPLSLDPLTSLYYRTYYSLQYGNE